MKTKISRMVGLLTIPFLIFATLAISIMAVQAAPSVSINPATTSVNQSDTFSVSININPDGKQVKGVDIKLKFAPSAVQLGVVNIGGFLGSDPMQLINSKDNTNGELELAFTVKPGNPAVTASGTLATLNFVVKSNAPAGTSNLDLTMAVLSDSDGNTIPGVVPNDGTVTVGPGVTPTVTVTATPTVTLTATPTATATPPPTLSVSIIPGTKTVNQSDTFSVGVIVNPLGKQVKGVDVKLKFAPSVVQLNSVDIGSFLGSDPMQLINSKDNTNGELELAFTVKPGNPAVTASGTFATLNFMVKSNAPVGTSNLDLTMAVLSDSDGNTIPGVAMNDGTITVSTQGGPSDTKVWKFITVPFELENSSVDYVLKGVNYTMIYAWDPIGKKPVTPVMNLKPLNGYVIRMNDSSQEITNLVRKSGPYAPSSLDVYKGWNLIGTSGTNPMSAEMNLQPIDDSYYGILNWNVPAQMYDIIGINRMTVPQGTKDTGNFTMQPKVSYWVWATANTSMPADLLP